MAQDALQPSDPFLGELDRARVGARGHDLRAILRSGASDEELADAIETIWLRRGDRYSELRSQATSSLPRIEMFAMGG